MSEKKETKFIEKVMAVSTKISNWRLLRSFFQGLQFAMPLIIIGAIIQIVTVILMIAGVDTTAFTVLNDLSFGIIGIVMVFGIAFFMVSDREDISPTAVGIIAVSMFFIMCKPAFDTTDSLNPVVSFNTNYFGSLGLFPAIVIGAVTAEIFRFFYKRKWTLSSKNIPDFVNKWFSPIIPGFVILLLGWVVTYVLDFNIFTVITRILTPILTVNDSLAAIILCSFIANLMWVFGIHPAAVYSVIIPFLLAAWGENVAMASQGLAPTHINTAQTLGSWILLGGTGATLTLNFLLLRSKSATLRGVGKAALIPSIFNINEPLVYGIPIAMNPSLAIPLLLNGGIINPALTWLAMTYGLVKIPYTQMLLLQAPAGLGAFLANQDWRGVVLVVILLAINLAVWYPFYKGYEKIVLAKETDGK
jgi:PTS system cellobiose-specific IIC component